jgi:predicted nucleic acid-binding protein
MSVEIFLDTNVFESARFSYSSENMKTFLEYCSCNGIKLKITNVVKHEVDKRISANIKETFEDINKNNLAVVASSIKIDPSTSKLKIIEELIRNLIDDFNDFIDDNDVEIIDSDCDTKELIAQYFDKKSPFTEQKKHEFPDAIILLTIKKYIKDNPNKTITTISNDESFIEFSRENNINNFNFISSALNYLIQNPNIALKNAFDRQLEDIKEQIVEQIEGMGDFILYSYDSIDLVDVDDIFVKGVAINDLNIIKFEESDKVLYLNSNLSIEFSCNASYPDPDTLHYDKEDGVYYSFTQCISKINLTENITCSLEIAFDEKFDFEIVELKLYNKEFEFSLDERYIISTEYESDNINTF